jgi:hypothetical protein
LFVEANGASMKTDVSNLVCSMQRNWRLILQILHTTVFLILYIKMFTINNPMHSSFWSKITLKILI